ncbi:MAG: hypothetical protein J6Y47_06085 [Bacteroidales bacterium]|nr:hypothetical protein [Bacteroidales bacterium]
MSVNTVTFQQSATVLNSIVHQQTGQSAVISTEADFISVAQIALSLPKDSVINAISGVLARSIFINRPYTAKMKGLQKDMPTWGAYMRKLGVIEDDWDENQAFKYPVTYDATETGEEYGDGKSVDMFVQKKRKVQETNFMGQSTFQDHYTLYEKQYKTAFRNSGEFGSFISMIGTNMQNKIELAYEGYSRQMVANFIASLIKENNSSRVVKLVTLYNAELGLTGDPAAFTATTVLHPDNYPAFIKWAYAKIASIASLMTEYSTEFQTTINSAPILKHTPYNKQRAYILGGNKYAIESRVLTDTFHNNYIDLADAEIVNFWQGIKTPDKIVIKPTYTNTSGVATTAATAVTQTGVFGVLFDDDALGWNISDESVDPTPYVANGHYWNLWYSFLCRTMQDNTEKGVVFLLE